MIPAKLRTVILVDRIIELIRNPWPWYVGGPMIALIMSALLFMGKSLSISSNLRSICAMVGAGKTCAFFDVDWRAQTWNLVFLGGLVIGGIISAHYLTSSEEMNISAVTIQELRHYGVEYPRDSLVPLSLFSWDSLFSLKGFLMLVVGGFLVGFGTRYAGGCTSGHAISGLSDLQRASLVAVIGFFIGGLVVTNWVLPSLLTL